MLSVIIVTLKLFLWKPPWGSKGAVYIESFFLVVSTFFLNMICKSYSRIYLTYFLSIIRFITIEQVIYEHKVIQNMTIAFEYPHRRVVKNIG